jgi:amino acid transporter
VCILVYFACVLVYVACIMARRGPRGGGGYHYVGVLIGPPVFRPGAS